PIDREPEEILVDLETGPYRLGDFQQFHLSLDAEKGFDTNPFLNYIALTEEVGELARAFKLMWSRESRLRAEGLSSQAALQTAMATHRAKIQEELADCLAYLFKLSNYAGIDLEQAYLEKMNINARRIWQDSRVVRDGREDGSS
ncbi:MAG: hypothetical protein GYB68_14595, partial [Chloroflexi bacterium]|nr:hypothetical protein [Chloroflexota bacterium]